MPSNGLSTWNTPEYPPSSKPALLHVQFESISSFLGRERPAWASHHALSCSQKALNQPLLYLSLYFKTYPTDYYRLLQQMREQGTWEAWLEFFVQGVGNYRW